MKKTTLFKTVLLLCALIVGSGSVWATDFTLSSASSVTIDNITVSFAKGSGSTAPTWYGAGLRLYASNTVTITSTAEKIAAITFNWEKQGNKAFASATASTGSYTHPNNTGKGNWSGSTASVTFTLGSSGQLQLNTLSVTLESPAPSYTITAVSNNNTLGTVSLTGSTITASPTSGNQVSTSEPYTVTSGTATVAQSGNVFTVTPSTDCTVRINFVPIPTYVVTIETPTGGTLVVKNGDDDVASGDAFPAGTVLSITATPGAEYNFRNIQVVDASTHTYTASNTKDYTLTANNTTIKANFDAKVYHAVNWYVNGSLSSTVNVEEGHAITKPVTDPSNIGGKKFMGWTDSTIDGTTDTEPTYFTSANMGTSDVNYYAVFATPSAGGSETATLTANTSWSSYADKTFDDDKSNEWSGNCAGQNMSGTYYYGLSNNGSSYIESPTFIGNITAITAVVRNGSSTETRYFYINSEKGKTGDLGSITVPNGTDGSEIDAVLSGASFKKFYLEASKALQFSSIAVTYSSITYSAYCTDVTTSVDVTTYGWATFSSDYALDFTDVEGLEAYMITGHDGVNIVKSQVTGTVPANTGLLLKGDADTYSIPVVASSSTVVSENKMVAGTGASVSAEANKTKYVLGVNGSTGKAEFQKIVSTSATVPAGKAYLQFDEVIDARALQFDEGETTAISEVRGLKSDVRGEFYNLNGQRVAQPSKGLYIVNGKKVMFK